MSEDASFEWLRAAFEHLDALDYFALLEVPDTADREAIRDAFHRFASHAHPDRHVGDDEALAYAHTVFKRGTEAYRVLMNDALRAKYTRLRAEGHTRMPLASSAVDLDDVPASVRPMYDKARASLAAGRIAEARMYVQLAKGRGSCDALEALSAEVSRAGA